MDLSKLKIADRLIILSTLVLFVASFLTWFTIEIDGGLISLSYDAWDTENAFLWAFVPIALGVAMVAVTVIRRFAPARWLPDLPIGRLLFYAGVPAPALVLLKFLVGEDVGTGMGHDLDVNRSFGLFLALLAAIGLAYGGYLEWRQEEKGVGGGTPPTPF